MSKFADLPNKFADEPTPYSGKFADIPETPPPAERAEGSVAWVLERFINEMDGGVRPLGESHRCELRKTQRSSIGPKDAATLTNADVIEWAEELVKTVLPTTVDHYVTALGAALRYAGSNPKWKCPKISDAAVKGARPYLKVHGIIGKSEPRTRRPQKEEKAKLEVRFEKTNRHPNCKTDMVRVSRWQLASTRRIGESCALLWLDWNYEKKIILVRKMKDPKRRNKQKVVALPWDAQELLLEWAREMNDKPELRTDETRILPYNPHTCSQRYTKAKKKEGIENLHLHDDRRDRCSRLVEDDGFSKEEATAFSGHETTDIFERNYMELDAALIAQGPASRRNAGVVR